jgi:hypothetical protein
MAAEPRVDKTFRRQVHGALIAAFPTESAFRQMVHLEMGENLDLIAPRGNLPSMVLSVLRWAEARGRVKELIAAAFEANPGNPDLAALVQRSAEQSPGHSKEPNTDVQHTLERLTKDGYAVDTVVPLLIDARGHLESRNHDAAEHLCMEVFRDDPDHFYAHLLTAVAILGGGTADRLSQKALRRTESHLKVAAETADVGTAWAIWGIVRFDAYRINNITMGEPGLTTIRAHLERLGRHNLDHGLLALISRTRGADHYFGLDRKDTAEG